MHMFCDLGLPQMYVNTEHSFVWGKCLSRGPKTCLHVKNCRRQQEEFIRKITKKKNCLETRNLYK